MPLTAAVAPSVRAASLLSASNGNGNGDRNRNPNRNRPSLRLLLRTAVGLLAAWTTAASLAAEAGAVTPAVARGTAASAPAAGEGVLAVHAHTTQHRAILLKGMSERRNMPEPELRARCRFESDIATAPPRRQVALSFDDGPEPGHTESVLALLDKYGIPASFFMIGSKAERYPELAAKVHDHALALVGNHSWTHPNFHAISIDAQLEELTRADARLAAFEHPKLFRFPYGNSTCEANEFVHGLGYRIVGWHVDSCDWAFDKTGSVDAHEALSCGVERRHRGDFVGHVLAALELRQGGILLLHEIHPNTLAQLDGLIGKILAAGFEFVPLDAPQLEASMR